MHADPDLIALLALGEDEGTVEERHHVTTCPQCADDLAEYQRLTTLARRAGGDTIMAAPSADVWARIRAELAFDTAPAVVTAAEDEDQLTAHVRLLPVASSWSAAFGTAELATDERGRRLLQVALHADLPTSGVRQAWLVHRSDPTRRQTLGILDGTHGLWTVDHSIDLAEFGILDISQQAMGQAEHSGQTIVRGELALAS